LKILIAVDKFKTTLSSRQVAKALTRGIRKSCPAAEMTSLIVSDGGEGFIEAIGQADPLRIQPAMVSGPLGKPRPGYLGVGSGGKRIYVESAQATGFHLVPPQARNPINTSSAGLADLLKEAVRHSPEEIYVGLGSSATCDAGLPVARRFGVRFYSKSGAEVQGRPEEMIAIDRIEGAEQPLLGGSKLYAVADVNSPPIGALGGVRVFSPQKGASAQEVQMLEEGMEHLVSVLEKQLGHPLEHLAGAGAAGCLGLGLHTLFGAQLLSGSELLFDRLRLKYKIASADAVITGEGSFDEQSLSGKVPGKILSVALEAKKRVFLVTGKKQIPQRAAERVVGALSIEGLIEQRVIPGLEASEKGLEIHGKRIGEQLIQDVR